VTTWLKDLLARQCIILPDLSQVSDYVRAFSRTSSLVTLTIRSTHGFTAADAVRTIEQYADKGLLQSTTKLCRVHDHRTRYI
jgi:hypothetical protein